MDAAEKVIKSNKEIRQVLMENDQSQSKHGTASGGIFGNGKVVVSQSEEQVQKMIYA